jgi:predicted nuclease of predicted toxin-antitoxin system
MTLLCDEGVQRPVVEQLRIEGHDVLYVAELEPGVEDEVVLTRAAELHAPLVTTDKDFGELVFRQGKVSAGVVLLRLSGLSNEAKARIVAAAVREHSTELIGAFTVLSPGRVRIRPALLPGEREASGE